ncbi:hypothetical protein [Pseudaestuariivita atlantica]|uniref:Uncharacterized protein n=1 Tax=Pseudaestuariivita atlantica TaxID=1317121 RepID=A0A0L1JT62_9RHOB|nr:hypothetical protein [Pseudaestuariivita atlantica]KNG94925.1 hypothetical protein ATO11_06045 [Pseudaestuariivita atlantica]
MLSCLAVTACSDPLRNVERLEDVPLVAPDAGAADTGAALPTTAQVSAEPQELNRRPGLLGLFKRSGDAEAAAETAASGTGAPSEADPADAPQAEAAPASDATVDAVVADVAEVEETAKPRRGLLGGFLQRARSASARAEAVEEEKRDAVEPAGEEVAALAPDSVAAPETDTEEAAPRRRGLFGQLSAARGPRIDPDAPDARVVPYGTPVNFGEVVRVCDVPRNGLGKEIARYPEKRPTYRLYDSKPKQTGLRTHYLTGFKDGCARQFTAALALFGEAALHEQLRYGLPSKVQPYSATDEAYETVKGRVCRAAKGKPCGAKIEKLAQTTVFVSTYERYEGSASWANILLHDGTVVEKDKVGN